MPAGRPSKYNSTYCDQVIELGRQGKSYEQISAAIDVPRATMDSWAKVHPQFSAALTRAKELEHSWWEEVGQSALFADKFQHAVWAKSMQARFRDKYTEKQQIEHSGPNGREIPVSIAVRLLTPSHPVEGGQ